MHLRGSAIVCAARPHGEVGVIVRLLLDGAGLVSGYVAGGRGRLMRPVLIAGNVVAAELVGRVPGGLPGARLELMVSRGPFMTEPLPAAAIVWATTLTAATLAEGHDYPLYPALAGLLDAVCHAPSARAWAGAMMAYEALVLREMGYGRAFGAGGDGQRYLDPQIGEDWPAFLAGFDALGGVVARYLLVDRRRDVMGARDALRARLARIAGT